MKTSFERPQQLALPQKFTLQPGRLGPGGPARYRLSFYHRFPGRTDAELAEMDARNYDLVASLRRGIERGSRVRSWDPRLAPGAGVVFQLVFFPSPEPRIRVAWNVMKGGPALEKRFIDAESFLSATADSLLGVDVLIVPGRLEVVFSDPRKDRMIDAWVITDYAPDLGAPIGALNTQIFAGSQPDADDHSEDPRPGSWVRGLLMEGLGDGSRGRGLVPFDPGDDDNGGEGPTVDPASSDQRGELLFLVGEAVKAGHPEPVRVAAEWQREIGDHLNL